MQSILNMSAPRSGKLYKEKAPRAECFFWLRGLDLNCTVLHFLCGENAAVSSAALTVRRTVIHYRLTLRVIRPRAHTPRSGKLYKKSTPCGMLFWLVAPKKISPQRRIICPRIMLIEKLDSDQNVSFVVLSIKLVFLILQPFPHRYPR